MAICLGSVMLWRHLKANGLLPPHPSILEIGQSNWSFDISPLDCPEFAGVDWTSLKDEKYPAFAVAKLFYRSVMDYSRIVSVDFSGPPEALKLDLNRPLPITEEFDVTINTGTGEHVFDQLQFFLTMHERTKVGGVMVHAAPICGWPSHSLYVYQPQFFSLLAAANEYETLGCVRSNFTTGEAVVMPLADVVTGLGDCMVHLAWRKVKDERFCVPYQGIL